LWDVECREGRESFAKAVLNREFEEGVFHIKVFCCEYLFGILVEGGID
jgi:hypothetical protein